MILTVNDKSYELDDISTSSEFYLNTDSAEKAITIYTELRSMRAYTYGGRLYADRVVSKFMLSDVRGEGIRIYIKLRTLTMAEETEQELVRARSELQELKDLVAPIINSNSSLKAVKTLQAAYPGLIKPDKEVI